MSKERARRREAREAEAAARAEQRAAVAARDARRAERRAAWRRRLGPLAPRRSGGPTGILARRRQVRFNLIVISLVLVQVLVWIARPDWGARLGALVIALLAFPVIAAFAL